MIADGFNGSAVHLANHDVMLSAVSRAPLAKLLAYKRRMGWTFPWASSLGGDFNFDFNVSFTEEQQREGGLEYNYRREPPTSVLTVFFVLIDTAQAWALTVALVVAQLALSMMYGPQAAFFSEMFSARVRYSGASLGYQIGAALGGGFSPVIATALLAATGTTLSISIYMILLAVLAIACVWALTETYENDMEDDAEVSGPPSPTSPR